MTLKIRLHCTNIEDYILRNIKYNWDGVKGYFCHFATTLLADYPRPALKCFVMG